MELTPESFKKEMEALAAVAHLDREATHGDMDDLMVRALRELGFGEGCNVFEETERWYG